MCGGRESGRLTFVPGVRLDLKRPKLIDAGAMNVLKAWEDGVSRGDGDTTVARFIYDSLEEGVSLTSLR